MTNAYQMELIPAPPDPKEIDQLADVMAQVFSAPLVVFPGGWEDTLPPKLKEHIVTERLIECMVAGGDWPLATEGEVMAYLYTHSLCFPLGSMWTHIYVWLVSRWKPQAAEMLDRDLNLHEQRELNELRRHMREKQRKTWKERRKAAERQA